MRQRIGSALVKIMACRLFGTKPYGYQNTKLFIHENASAVFTKIIGHVGHFRWLGPNVWWEISQIWIEYIKPIGQMSDEPWKFFMNTASENIVCKMATILSRGDELTVSTPQKYAQGCALVCVVMVLQDACNGGSWDNLANSPNTNEATLKDKGIRHTVKSLI